MSTAGKPSPESGEQPLATESTESAGEEASSQSQTSDESGSPADRRGWVALLAVILMSVTAIATAWTGFQASKWGGAMSIAFTQAGAARLESAALAAEADRRRAMQVSTFSAWVVASAQGDTETAEALSSRFKEPLKSAFAAYIATDPLNNPDAPDTPFDMPEYVSPELAAANEAGERADALFAEGLANNQQGDNYTILVVLGATVLFFTAMSDRVKRGRNQWILLGTAIALFAVVAYFLIEFPKLL